MINNGEKLSETELEDLLQLADQNHDGKINYSGMLIEWMMYFIIFNFS